MSYLNHLEHVDLYAEVSFGSFVSLKAGAPECSDSPIFSRV